MNSISFLLSYLCEYFKNKKYSVIPYQKQFDISHKQPIKTRLYYGLFTIDDVLLENKFLNSSFSANKNNPVFFTNLQNIQDIENINFIGWVVDFVSPIFIHYDLLEITNFMHLQGGSPPRIQYDTNKDSHLLFYGKHLGQKFSYDLGFQQAGPAKFFNDDEKGIISLSVSDYPVFFKNTLTGQIIQFNNNGQTTP